MKGKAAPLVGLRGRRGDRHPGDRRRLPPAVPRPRRGGRHRPPGPGRRALPGRAGSSPSTAPPGWASRASSPRPSTRPRRPRRPVGCSSTPSRTAPPAPTACCVTPCASCWAIDRGEPRGHGRRPARRPRPHRRPTCCPLAPLLADIAQVDVPTTPEADRIDQQYRADRAADVVIDLLEQARPRAARRRRRGGPLGRRRVGRACSTASPWRPPGARGPCSSSVAARPVGSPRRPAPPWSSARCPGRGRRAPRHRGDRGHSPATARDRGRRRAGPGQPAVRRGGHARRPRAPGRWRSCPSRSRPR